MKKVFAVLVILLFIALGFAASEKTKPTLFSYLPQKDIYGKTINYNKKVYLIDVWATWCPPCRQTIPELIALQSAYASKNVEVIGLSVDSTGVDTVKDFAKEAKINYHVAMAENSLKYLPTVRGIPTMFIVNKEGKIVGRFVGYTERMVLARAIDEALGK